MKIQYEKTVMYCKWIILFSKDALNWSKVTGKSQKYQAAQLFNNR